MSNYIVYKSENAFTGEIYIGATTKSLDQRKNDHLQKSCKGSNVLFHQAIGTYGSDSFIWKQLDSAASLNELAEKETEYIYMYDSFQNGYNSDKGGGFKKTVYQYNIETGELINSYDDLVSAGNAVNANKRSISNACLHTNKTCRGYHWSYSSTSDLSSTLDLRKKTVNQLSLDGGLIARYESASEASRKTGISKTCITRCCRKEREQTGGFLWEYI
ncbi:NUMOD1 domain-containing DNA-binding protein [Flavobacterium sp.]|uniref:NUMOD1 domain-containing DNA-binding protein n=1 Tax=Flavobacterium sp. TaxID=239 RepID=UPI002C568CD8|nr:NUMOD1 domain-containing DNA-binding protein [Flavobacterium sp.]HSD08864.1 NUMOD1 domain-containing DNA-binding protein [Flavobacterium sp.]